MKKWILAGGLGISTVLLGTGYVALTLRIAEMEVTLRRTLNPNYDDSELRSDIVHLLYRPFLIYKKESTKDVLDEHIEVIADRRREMDHVR